MHYMLYGNLDLKQSSGPTSRLCYLMFAYSSEYVVGF